MCSTTETTLCRSSTVFLTTGTALLLLLLLDAVDDEAFWQGVQPLEFGPLPRLQDSVAVVGYPIGGDTISVTVGVVSRIEVGLSLCCHFFAR
jgi:hypothetical protein